MRRRRLAAMLVHAVLAATIVSHPAAAPLAAQDDGPEAEATATPTSAARATPEAAQATPEEAAPPAAAAPTAAADPFADWPAVQPNNNVVGLNVARLRRDRYIWAAADLVNANGGDWGYLTVVFTAAERDSGSGDQLLQDLLDRCFESHLQPIIRLATRFDEAAETWSRPEPDDPERWRAFLERGRWPTKRAWIIAGNEPNLGREWGGEVDSASYAEYLSHFLDVFADSDRFMVTNGPLDASNATEMPKMQDAYEFLGGMGAAVPGIFGRLAGWASNPYSVPHQGPDLRYTHRAYEAELQAIGRDMPVLITEAGHLNTGDEKEVAAFYQEAFRDWMADPRVVAVTPLFWHPDRGVYWMFDFDKDNKIVDKSPSYELMLRLPRGRGSPVYEPDVQNVARGGRPSGPKPTAVALAPRPAADGSDPPPESPASSESSAAPPATATPEQEKPTPMPLPAMATPVPATATPLPPTPTARAVIAPSFGSAPNGAIPSPTPATTAARFFRVGNTDGAPVRVRSMPSRTATSVTSVTEGARVQGLGSSERQGDLTWQRVRIANGIEGWIATDFLTPD